MLFADLLQIIYNLIPLIIGQEGNGKTSDEKKKGVIDGVKKVIIDLKINIPKAIIPIQDYLLGLLVDMLVLYLNRINFLKKSNPL